jgi:hypothetical protein
VLLGETVRDGWSIRLGVAREGIAVRRAPCWGLSGRVRHIARGLICRGERDDSGGCPTFLVGWTPAQPCRFARTRHSDRAHYNTAIYKRSKVAAQMIYLKFLSTRLLTIFRCEQDSAHIACIHASPACPSSSSSRYPLYSLFAPSIRMAMSLRLRPPVLPFILLSALPTLFVLPIYLHILLLRRLHAKLLHPPRLRFPIPSQVSASTRLLCISPRRAMCP